jgi:hypothetical protein
MLGEDVQAMALHNAYAIDMPAPDTLTRRRERIARIHGGRSALRAGGLRSQGSWRRHLLVLNGGAVLMAGGCLEMTVLPHVIAGPSRLSSTYR